MAPPENVSDVSEEKNAEIKPVTHVIFDMDGLLLDTEGVDQQIVTQIAEKYGKEYTHEIRLAVLGTTEQTTSTTVVERCGLPITPEEFRHQFHALHMAEVGNCSLMPGAERLIRHLHAKKIPIAVATSSGKDLVKAKTENYQELFSLFHHVVMGSSDPEVKNGKPAPDIFQVCASRFDDKPACDQCLVFEDSPNGVTGARAANMQTVMVPDPDLPKDRTAHSTIVLKSLLDFKPEIFGLPAF